MCLPGEYTLAERNTRTHAHTHMSALNTPAPSSSMATPSINGGDRVSTENPNGGRTVAAVEREREREIESAQETSSSPTSLAVFVGRDNVMNIDYSEHIA